MILTDSDVQKTNRSNGYSIAGNRVPRGSSSHSRSSDVRGQDRRSRNTTTSTSSHCDTLSEVDRTQDTAPPPYTMHDPYPHDGRNTRRNDTNRGHHQANARAAPVSRQRSPNPFQQLPRMPESTGCVQIKEVNSQIKGTYIIDPDKFNNPQRGRMMDLSTSNGSIDVDVAVVPPTRAGIRDKVELRLASSCGSVKMRLHDPPSQATPTSANANITRPVVINAKSSNGTVHLCIPRSYHGLISARSLNGSVKFSEGIKSSMTTVRKNDASGPEVVFFVGDRTGLPELATAAAAAAAAAATAAANANHENDRYANGRNNLRLNNVLIESESFGRSFFVGTSNFNIGPGGLMFNVRNGSRPGRREQRCTGPTPFESSWEGDRANCQTMNGTVQIAYDDEHAFGSFGGWARNNQGREGGRRGGSYYNFSGIDWQEFMNVGGNVDIYF
ncbi:hypothetical protein AX15_004712 [Amanita polypyramis BW_CC]|nr:hypothetical protein AX15_004712 [Amanita polypyramis BW_CC]